MRIAILAAALVAATTLSGCIWVVSHSYSYVEVDRRPPVSRSDWTATFLHLTEPLVENVVVDLTHQLETQCAGAPLVNLQTKVFVHELVLFQIYRVRLSGYCGSAPPRPAMSR